ncbi:N-acetylmuramoyl-L-alanine amidase [Paenibacillus sp. GSMTC-2017]|uniref:N-acetylmuramoyl-L-alanine amidase n=1 Tax=Paenibacillus sp. GSMTC-2017 TaxID=2794350 RepID=UPI0018D965FF|nr:N-acetylmuramoyl-L-alanine amidase [Paenibacillus sp. GSMTC-2017]MBH5316690.1 N-acetylmuramoyl-L-alanine amidase [Paenibacillus sp. GSMTC-2017]
MEASTITIHNTANPASTAMNERNWLTNPSNKRTASYHLVIDENEVIECLPLNETAWHSGDGSSSMSGNRSSIGIEICESGDYEKTLDNAVALVAKLLIERGWGIERLRRHFDWSGKICPRLMYDGGEWTGWTEFKKRVATKLKPEIKPVSEYVNIRLDGNLLAQKGTLKNGVTTVPVRAIAEAFGAKVSFNEATRTVIIDK